MDVRLSREQRELRDAAVRIMADLASHAVGELSDAERSARLDRAVGDAGWRELRAPASADGEPWASGVEVAVIAEVMGRGAADAPFVGPTLAAELRRLAGAPIAEAAETVVLTTSLSGFATSTVDGVAIDAAGAVRGLLLQPVADGWALSAVGLAPAEVRVDLTRPAASINGAPDVIAGQTRVLSDDDVSRVIVLALALASADLVGAMDGAVTLAIDYARERQQYGRVIGSFQAVQHLLADAFAITEGARSAALHAAWAVDALPLADALHAASVAKAYASRAARTACETSIQVHGGIGNTWECMAHVYLRRSLQSIDMFGGIDASLERVLAHHGIAVA